MQVIKKSPIKKVILAATMMIITSLILLDSDIQADSERMLLVDFGTVAEENSFAVPGWNTIEKSPNMTYTDDGAGGLTKTSGEHQFDSYVRINGTPFNFEAGDEIIVTWYNGTGEMVSLWNPLISFEDSDYPEPSEGEPQWYIMKSTGESGRIDYMHPGQTRESVYVVTSTETILGMAPPTQGKHAFININVNSPQNGIICDKIELVRAVDSSPSQPTNVSAQANNEAPDSRIDLTWSASKGEVNHYRIYRDGLWVDKTVDTQYTDSNLEHSSGYTYTVQAFRNHENKSILSEKVHIKTASFQGNDSLVDPQKDLEYLGAFRFPSIRASSGSKWNYRHGDIAYYPLGDLKQVDGDSEYPGSLYAFGFRPDGKVAEISIPTPVKSKNYNELPRSQTLQDFHNVRPANTPVSYDIGAPGLTYVPSKNRFYQTFNDNYNVSFKKKVTHGSFAPDFSDIQGLWFVGGKEEHHNPHYDTYNKFLTNIPQYWATAVGIPEQLLLSGGYRAGATPQGPGLVAVQPWNGGNNSSPSPEAELQFTILLQYDLLGHGSKTLNGWIENDGWAGVAWLEKGNKSAVVLTGEKAYGEYYYGYIDGTLAHDSGRAVPRILPRFSGSKGGCARSYGGMILFYDPSELSEVAKGNLKANHPQPYAVLELDKYLLRKNPENPTMENWVRSVTVDNSEGLLYIVEGKVNTTNGPEDIIHVFKFGQKKERLFSQEQELEIDRGGEPFLPFAYRGDTISYNLNITNNFDEAISLVISDALNALVEYIAGTLKINGEIVKNDSLYFDDDLLEYEFAPLSPDHSLMISFEVIIGDEAPDDTFINNVALLTAYSFSTGKLLFSRKRCNVVQVQVKSPVPETSTVLFLGIGLIGILAIRRKRLN